MSASADSIPPAKSTMEMPHLVGGASGSPVSCMNPAYACRR